MAPEGESLGKARLDLEANLTEFRRNMTEGQRLAGGMDDRLKALAAVADIAEKSLGDVKMSGFSASESARIADRIERSVSSAGRAAMEATQHLQEVKLGPAQVAETEVSGHSIIDVLDAINRHANETNRALDRIALKRGVTGRPGVGVGPFGSGFGRIGVVGTLIGAGALTAPAAAPGALGLLAGIPTLATGAAGAIGALVLAFQGMGKAIGGDAKAFKELQPAQQQFVQTVRSMIPWLDRLKQRTGSIMFPGLTAGLRAAMSPGTVNAITDAITGFARAIGQAGEMWGHYFGSAQFQQIFGPLMQSAARNFTVLTAAAIRLFDALGVVGKAAIPLVNWLSDAAAKGAALADSWLRAQAASGGLGRAMATAQESLRLVGRLALALGGAVVALGRALYPVAMVVVPALTNGFNALAGWINRNRQTISLFGVAIAKDIIAVVKTAVTVVGDLGRTIDRWFGPAGVRVAIIATAAAIGLLVSPWGTVLAAAVLVAGEIIRHWETVKTWFRNFGQFEINVFQASWTAIKGIVNLGVYAILVNLKLLTAGLKFALGWIPGLGGKIKAALASVDTFIDDFRRRGVTDLTKAGAEMGNAWGAAFDQSVQDALDKVNSQGVMKTVPMEGTLSGTHQYHPQKKNEAAPGTHAWYIKYLGYDPTLPTATDSGVFGTPPPFDKNVPAGKKKTPPLIPPVAQHALDLASANANKASNLGNVGAAAERYLRLEITDLETAARIIRAKYESAAGKARTQLFHAYTSVLNKIRDARKQLADTVYQDRMSSFQFALDMAQLAMDKAKQGTAAYKKAEQQEIKTLRAEIAYLDKRVKNKKLSLAARQEALSAEISAQQQLNALLGEAGSDIGKAGANEAQFLSSAQDIIHNYAPNFSAQFPEPPSMKQTETKGYETVQELRGIRRILERIENGDEFPASGYAVASAQGAFG